MINIRLNQKNDQKRKIFDIVSIQKVRSSHGNKFLDKLGIFNKKKDHWDNKIILINMVKFTNWVLKGAFLNSICFGIIKIYVKYLTKKEEIYEI